MKANNYVSKTLKDGHAKSLPDLDQIMTLSPNL